MSRSSDSLDKEIPVLTDVVVSGHESHAKPKRGKHAKTAHPHSPPHSPADDSVPVLDHVIEPSFLTTPEPATASRLEPTLEPAQRPVHEPAVFTPGEAEFTSGSIAERYVPRSDPGATSAVPMPVPAVDTREYDADVLAERLRGRFATYLTGAGRDLIEARCRDAFQDHTTWLVSQITREVALALETEMLSWVREAIREEMGKGAEKG